MNSRMLMAAIAGALASWAVSAAAVERVGPEFQVNVYTSGNQYQADIAFDGDGTFVVVWQSYDSDGPQNGIFGQRFDSNGAHLGPEFQIDTNTSSDARQQSPAVAVDASGNFVVAWEGYESYGQTQGVFARRFSNSGVAAGDAVPATARRAAPAICSSATGEFVVVWWDDGGPSAQRFGRDGAPLGGAIDVGGGAAEIPPYLGVACNEDGSFVVAWTGGQDGDGAGLLARQFDAMGASIGPEFQVNEFTTGRQLQPAVCTDQDGDFVIVWTNELTSVHGRRFDRGGSAQGDDFQIHSDLPDSGLQWRPDVACDARGAFVVVWNSGEYDHEILARAFDATGAAQGDEFQVHTSTAYYYSVAPAVSAGEGGDFVIVWQDGYKGYNWDVLAQRFSGLAPPVGLVPGGPLKKTNSDCYQELEIVGVENDGQQVENNKKVLCTDGTGCDSDGQCDNICAVQVAVCVNQTDSNLPDCMPPAMLERAKVKVKGKTAVNIQAPQLLTGSTCGPSVTVPVEATFTKKGKYKANRSQVKVFGMAKAPRGTKSRKDRDKWQIRCLPNTNPASCPPPATEAPQRR